MEKDSTYHTSAVQYNEGLAEAAEKLAETLKHPEIQKWCRGVGKQHRFHAKRHKAALSKLNANEDPDNVERIADGLDVPDEKELSIEEEQAKYAAEQISSESVPTAVRTDATRDTSQDDQRTEVSPPPSPEDAEPILAVGETEKREEDENG